MDRLYVVVRDDLPAGAQACQAVHATDAFAVEHPELTALWRKHGGNLVFLSVPDLRSLSELMQAAGVANVSHAAFYETDFGGELTAAAFAASARRLVSALPLALRDFVRAA